MRTTAEIILGILAIVGIILGVTGRCMELVADVIMDCVERMYAKVTGERE